MYQDDIVAEVWRNRDAYAARHHHSLAEMVADLRARQNRAGRNPVDRRNRARPCEPARTAADEANA